MGTRNRKNKNDLQCIQNTDNTIIDTKEWLEKGLAFRDAGDYEAAVGAFTKVIEMDSNDIKALTQRGIIYAVFLRKPELAINDLSKVIQTDPQYAVPLYILRGIVYKMLEEYARAIEDFNMAIKLGIKDELTYDSRGTAYMMLGKVDKAVSDFNKVIEINPEYASAYNNRGIAYTISGDSKKAITEFAKAIEIEPKDASHYHMRGCAYLNLGEFHTAITDFDTAIKINPKAESSYYKRGVAYDNLGDRQKAVQNYKLAVSLGDEEAIKQLESKGINK